MESEASIFSAALHRLLAGSKLALGTALLSEPEAHDLCSRGTNTIVAALCDSLTPWLLGLTPSVEEASSHVIPEVAAAPADTCANSYCGPKHLLFPRSLPAYCGSGSSKFIYLEGRNSAEMLRWLCHA